MTTITSEDEVIDVLKQIGVGEGQELRESKKRKTTLEKFAQLRSRNPHVQLELKNTPTAFVAVDEEMEEFKNITVTTKEFEQEITNLPSEYFDYLVQRAMTVHEVGHILYSSWPALEKFMDKVGDEEDIDTEAYKLMFRHFVNALEDGAIEKFLKESYRVEEELFTLRATLHEKHYVGKEYNVEGQTEYHYPFFFAVMTALINIGVYDNGELDALLDDSNDLHFFAKRGGEHEKDMFEQNVLPEIKKYIPLIQSEGDAERRMELCYELWDYIRDYIDRSTTPGKTEWQRESQNMEGDSYAEGVPNDLSEGHGEQEAEPLTIVIEDAGEDSDGGSPSGLGEERNAMKAEEEAQDGSATDIEEKAEEGIVAEARQHGEDDWSDEIEQILDILGAGDGVNEIAIAESGDLDRKRKTQAERHGRRCERIFKRRLRELQRDLEQRERRRGRLDSRKMVDASRGSSRIFKRTKEGDQKDYSCIIVVDRSGSMSGRIPEVELAVGSIAYGLEENGVDTCILDTHNSMTTLSKPFGTNVDGHADRIFANRVGGGTPLTYTMKFARERISRGAGDVPFMIVITDGRPSNVNAFKDEVRGATFPVLGLYMTNNGDNLQDQLDLYDRAVAVSSKDDVSRKLINLINGVVF